VIEGIRFKERAVTQVLVGLGEIAFDGLPNALEAAVASGVEECKQLGDLIVRELDTGDSVPDDQSPDLRYALSRECLRHQVEDFSAFVSEVEVTVRGEPGRERDRFVELIRPTPDRGWTGHVDRATITR
jgi:hypothetical protein